MSGIRAERLSYTPGPTPCVSAFSLMASSTQLIDRVATIAVTSASSRSIASTTDR